MFDYFRSSQSLKNPVLHSMILEVTQLDEVDYRKNATTILSLLKKIASLAKKEKEWYVYLETLRHILYYETEFGDSFHTIKYSQLFFQACSAHLDEVFNQYPHTASSLSWHIISSYDDIFDAYKLFPEIDDKKWERFWHYFKDMVDRYGYSIYYWRCRLEFCILNRDIEMAKEIFKEYLKQPVDYDRSCYACIWLVVIGYYILIKDRAKAEEISNKILSQNIPQKAVWMYENCPRSTPFVQYRFLVVYSVITANPEAFSYFLPTYLELLNESPNTEVAYHHAAIGDFSALEEEIPIAAEDAEQLDTFPGWSAMKYMLSWMSYFKKLSQSGTTLIKITCTAKDFPEALENGYHLVDSLAAWFEKKADEFGAKFEKSRKQFTYQPLKESFLACCKLL